MAGVISTTRIKISGTIFTFPNGELRFPEQFLRFQMAGVISKWRE